MLASTEPVARLKTAVGQIWSVHTFEINQVVKNSASLPAPVLRDTGARHTDQTDGSVFPSMVPGEGEPCNEEGLCAGGLSCRYTEFSGAICARACSLDAPSTCGISTCLAQNDGTGVCSPGVKNDGETCEQAEDCLGGLCLRRGARKECARPCDDGRACRKLHMRGTRRRSPNALK